MLDCMTTPSRGGHSLIWDICMCSPKGYGFSAVLVINSVSILADFGHLGHKKGMVLHQPSYGYVFNRKENQQKPFTNYVYGNLILV